MTLKCIQLKASELEAGMVRKGERLEGGQYVENLTPIKSVAPHPSGTIQVRLDSPEITRFYLPNEVVEVTEESILELLQESRRKYHKTFSILFDNVALLRQILVERGLSDGEIDFLIGFTDFYLPKSKETSNE